jgi:hypothetical protein
MTASVNEEIQMYGLGHERIVSYAGSVMHFGKTVTLCKQRESAARIGDEAFLAQHQHGQTLMRLAQCVDRCPARTLERHATDIEPSVTRRIACEQAFDRCAIRTGERFARALGIGETRIQQNQ